MNNGEKNVKGENEGKMKINLNKWQRKVKRKTSKIEY